MFTERESEGERKRVEQVSLNEDTSLIWDTNSLKPNDNNTVQVKLSLNTYFNLS